MLQSFVPSEMDILKSVCDYRPALHAYDSAQAKAIAFSREDGGIGKVTQGATSFSLSTASSFSCCKPLRRNSLGI